MTLSVFRLTRGCFFPLLLLLAACSGEKVIAPDTPPAPPADAAPDKPAAASADYIRRAAFSDLPGWRDDRHDEALETLRRSCFQIANAGPSYFESANPITPSREDWLEACEGIERLSAANFRAFLEQRFTPFSVKTGEGGAYGLFTGYFEPQLAGSRRYTTRFRHPIYARPEDLVTVNLQLFDPGLPARRLTGQLSDGMLSPYPERGQIDAGALAGKGLELAWLEDPVDVFMLHVQGTGQIGFADGTVMRVGFAAHNGHEYRSIARRLIDDGELKRSEAGWDGIRRWVAANPDRAAALLAHNPRYIFFRPISGPGPIGSQGVALTPGRSLAVDPGFVPLGAPMWLDAEQPGRAAGRIQRLMIAQDTGAAIKGAVRGDFFWGHGPEARRNAERMSSRGRYFLLLPNRTATRLGLQ